MRVVVGLVLGTLLALLAPAPAWTKGGQRVLPGKTVERATKGGVQYALYIPKSWRRGKPLPLVVWVPIPRRMPTEVETAGWEQDLLQRFSKRKGGAFICVVLLQAHNKENRRDKSQIDPKRYVEFLERDVHSVRAVIDDACSVLPVPPGGVALRAQSDAAELAMGIAARRPEWFSAVFLTRLENVHVGSASGPRWFVLPQGALNDRALDLPIVLTYSPDSTNRETRAKKHRRVEAHLKNQGFRRVELVSIDPKLSYERNLVVPAFARFAALIEEGVVCARRCVERDKILAEGQKAAERGNLRTALRHHAKAKGLETKHDLPVTSQALYASIETRGRARLDAAKDLPPKEKKAAYRKVASLFKGTPLGDEVAKALKAMP